MLAAVLRASAVFALTVICTGHALAQQAPALAVSPRPGFDEAGGNGKAALFMQVPVSPLYPGEQPNRPPIKNPVQGDRNAEQRGMTYFTQFNCSGCHAANGGGGMGPALSNNLFIYGGQPENIYLSIYQGRPNGMPAWGAMLPDSVIWDLVTYIGKISNEPSRERGRTFSANPLSPQIEQLPAEQVTTTEPWSATKNFNFGQKP